MKDGHGRPQRVLLLGGSSEIGLAVVAALDLAPGGRVLLAGRPGAALEAAAARVRATAADVQVLAFDAASTDTHDGLVESAAADGDLDVVILAAGVLGDQHAYEQDPDRAVAMAQVNYVGGLSLALRCARLLRRQGHGALVLLSSVAGERARRSNFVYGSSKAGLDAVGTGLAEALRGTGAQVVVVRPGFVRTRMTAHLPEPPLAVDPAQVGAAVARALREGRSLVYVPAAMRPVMSVLRHLPRAVFRRLPI